MELWSIKNRISALKCNIKKVIPFAVWHFHNSLYKLIQKFKDALEGLSLQSAPLTWLTILWAADPISSLHNSLSMSLFVYRNWHCNTQSGLLYIYWITLPQCSNQYLDLWASLLHIFTPDSQLQGTWWNLFSWLDIIHIGHCLIHL